MHAAKKKINEETQSTTKRDPHGGRESTPLGGVAYLFHRKQNQMITIQFVVASTIE